jgi:hypothetical protein
MIDIAVLLIAIAAPITAWLISRNLTLVVVTLVLGIGLAGNVVQTSIALGMAWNVRGLQAFAVVVLLLVVLGAFLARGRMRPGSSMRTQLIAIVAPAVLVGVFLIVLRLLATDDPGPMAALGFLINHPMAEDNAKWLNLAAQLADGRTIAFNGYAGGPLLLLMSLVAAGMSVLSMILLGGVNEVAVVLNTVVGSELLLIALAPFALAPLAQWRLRGAGGVRLALPPAPLIWSGALVLVTANAALVKFGHLSLQFVLILTVLWATAFLVAAPRRLLLMTTLVIATTASVWLPLNVLGVVLLVVAIVVTARARDWRGLGLVLITLLVTFDSLFSSVLYLLGIEVSFGAADAADAGAVVSSGSSLVSIETGDTVASSTLIFQSPGATEIAQPLLTGLALLALIGAAVVVHRIGVARGVARFFPALALIVYFVVVSSGDAVMSGSAPNYGSNKFGFAVAVTLAAAYVPIAALVFDTSERRMTAVRWVLAASVLVVLTLDTLLPRALSTLSPKLWVGVDSASPAYWTAAEVKDRPDQPLSSQPVACLFVPPQVAEPTSLPLGQESYSCTRLMLGMTGLEGMDGSLASWLALDWTTQRTHWEEVYPTLLENSVAISDRQVISMDTNGGIAGFTTMREILTRNVPSAS